MGPSYFIKPKSRKKRSEMFFGHTAVVLTKNSLLHKQIKNHATLAYKNSVRKCYQDMFFITNMQFNNPTSMPQT